MSTEDEHQQPQQQATDDATSRMPDTTEKNAPGPEKPAAEVTPPPPPPPPPPPTGLTAVVGANSGSPGGPKNGPVEQEQQQQQQPKAAKNILKPPSSELGGGQSRSARKASVVSFHEKCELHEIDLEKRDTSRAPPRKPPAVFSLRYYIMLLALISPFVVTYSKTIINFAITDMVEPDYATDSGHSNSGGGGGGNSTTPPTGDYTSTPTIVPIGDQQHQQRADFVYFDHDNSCPVDEADRGRLLEELTKDKKLAIDRPGEKFKWDTVKQGFLKAAYSIGHALLPVFGSRLAEIFGSHWIMGLSSLLIGLLCLVAPWMASLHFYLMFADLFILGVVCSFMTPAMITLFSNWLTPSEKTMMISLYLVSSRLGYALSSLLCGLLINAQLSWRYLFLSAGWISLIFAGLFLTLSRSRPADHPFIKPEELAYLASKNTLVRERLAEKKRLEQRASPAGGEISELKTIEKRDVSSSANSNSNGTNINDGSQSHDNNNNNNSLAGSVDTRQQGAQKEQRRRRRPTGAPWLAILTNVPVWAFITTKFCVKLAGDTVQIELPTYLKRVMHFSPKANGLINSSNYVIFCLSCLLVGALAKTANKKRPFGWSKTTLRKVFQSTASFGVSLVLLGIAFSVCHNIMTQVLLMMMFFFTTFGTGGEAQLPMDLSERYAGTIHAIASSLAVSGAIEPILVGFLLQGHASDRNSWSYVWLGASGVAAFGGTVFLIFGEATIQGFDSTNDGGDGDDDDDTNTDANEDTQQKKTQHSDNRKLTNNLSGGEKKVLGNLKGAENRAFSTEPPEITQSDSSNGGEGGGDYRESAQI